MLIFIKLSFMNSLQGMTVKPFCCTAPVSLLISLRVSNSFLVLMGSVLRYDAVVGSAVMCAPRRKHSFFFMMM